MCVAFASMSIGSSWFSWKFTSLNLILSVQVVVLYQSTKYRSLMQKVLQLAETWFSKGCNLLKGHFGEQC